MKFRHAFGALLASFVYCLASAAIYEVNVTLVDQDLYRTSGGFYIKTAYCYQYFYGDNAILKYDAYASGNKLIFSTGASCEVEGVFK
ncbi:MAG TPA: hypothetical protein PLF10_13490 [Dokdonella sp.]|jgi:hypothetical protein|nr:hypothetical protein [Dokdonella sp.]